MAVTSHVTARQAVWSPATPMATLPSMAMVSPDQLRAGKAEAPLPYDATQVTLGQKEASTPQLWRTC